MDDLSFKVSAWCAAVAMLLLFWVGVGSLARGEIDRTDVGSARVGAVRGMDVRIDLAAKAMAEKNLPRHLS
ncbi:MAG: hypothetical protein OSB00_10275 [Sphingomonas bacterium]|nr:hypothetical protein [Sphingomonas bacterium]